MAELNDGFNRLLAVWNGDADIDTLDGLLAPAYRGRVGSRDRELRELKKDILAYRTAEPKARFRIEHQFSDGDTVATRLIAHRSLEGAVPETIHGMNISRWENGRLVEEWAAWESFSVHS